MRTSSRTFSSADGVPDGANPDEDRNAWSRPLVSESGSR